jgi:hypothetical protein
MTRFRRLVLLLVLGATAAAQGADNAATTRTGWFADEKCATSRASDGRTGPPGRSCLRVATIKVLDPYVAKCDAK